MLGAPSEKGRGGTMKRVKGQREGGGSTAEEPVRAETRLTLKIQRLFSNQASHRREKLCRRSFLCISSLHWELAMLFIHCCSIEI